MARCLHPPPPSPPRAYMYRDKTGVMFVLCPGACSPGPRTSCGDGVVMVQHRTSQCERGDHWPLSPYLSDHTHPCSRECRWGREMTRECCFCLLQNCLWVYVYVLTFTWRVCVLIGTCIHYGHIFYLHSIETSFFFLVFNSVCMSVCM